MWHGSYEAPGNSVCRRPVGGVGARVTAIGRTHGRAAGETGQRRRYAARCADAREQRRAERSGIPAATTARGGRAVGSGDRLRAGRPCFGVPVYLGVPVCFGVSVCLGVSAG